MLKAQANSGNARGLSALGDYADQQSAADFYAADIDKAAQTLAFKDSEVKYEADDFALKAVDFKYDQALKQQDFANAVALEGVKAANEMKLQEWKLEKGLYNDKINGGAGGYKPADIKAYENTEIDISKWNPELETYKLYMKNPDATTADMGNFTVPTGKDDLAKYRKAQQEARLNLTKLKNDANAKALKIGENPKYTDVITALEVEKSGMSEAYLTNYYQRILDKGLSAGLDKWTIDQYFTGKKGKTNESLYYQLEKLGRERTAYAEKMKNKAKK
jgi:hypothetical protein